MLFAIMDVIIENAREDLVNDILKADDLVRIDFGRKSCEVERHLREVAEG